MTGGVLVVAGGTGGHLYPGIAIARALRDHEPAPVPVQFAVRRGDLGRLVLEKEGFPVLEIEGQGLPRRMGVAALTFPRRLSAGFFQSRQWLREHRPCAVIGMGGYLSFPVLLNARYLGIPTIVHEQNVFPGIANRILSRWVRSVAVSFPESRAFFPKSKTWLSGLPIRSEIGSIDPATGRRALGLAENKLTILIFGGSQGARRLNEVLLTACKQLAALATAFQVLHITGEKEFPGCREAYDALPINHQVLPYCHQMAEAYAAADLVICRAGASTIAELLAAKRPAILVPFPYASDDHQRFNARVLEDRKLATVILEKDLSPETIATLLAGYIQDPSLLAELRKRFKSAPVVTAHAAQCLADFVGQWIPGYN